MASVPAAWKRNVTDHIGQEVDFSFKPEGRGLPAEKSYGQVQLELGERIGYDQRYTITRLLNFGGHSSTWLAWNQV